MVDSAKSSTKALLFFGVLTQLYVLFYSTLDHTPVAYAESFRAGGPKFRHNRVTSQISFMQSAEGTENRNPVRTPNTREKPALLLL